MAKERLAPKYLQQDLSSVFLPCWRIICSCFVLLSRNKILPAKRLFLGGFIEVYRLASAPHGRHVQQGRVMGSEQYRGLSLARQTEQQVGNNGAIGTVQTARWLIGQNNIRSRYKRARNRHTLLFAARQLRRQMFQSVGQTELCQNIPAAAGCVTACPRKRNGNITFSSALNSGSRL